MTDSPRADKARLDFWKADDEALAKIVTELDKKLFSLESWGVRDERANTVVPYSRAVEAANASFPTGDQVLLLQGLVHFLPEKLRVMKDETFSVLRRLAVNVEEKMNLVLEQDKRIAELEDENQELRHRLSHREVSGQPVASLSSAGIDPAEHKKVVVVVEKMGTELVKLQDQVMSLLLAVHGLENKFQEGGKDSSRKPARASRREY